MVELFNIQRLEIENTAKITIKGLKRLIEDKNNQLGQYEKQIEELKRSLVTEKKDNLYRLDEKANDIREECRKEIGNYSYF